MSSSEGKKEVLRKKLSDIRNDLLDTIKNLNAQDLNQRISSKNESWTIIDVLRHLFEAEKGMTTLMININKGSEGVPEDFDLNRYNKRSVQKLSEKSLDFLLNGFEENREKLFSLLSELSIEDLNKKGRHGTLLILTIEEIFNLIADHEKSHLEKIKVKL